MSTKSTVDTLFKEHSFEEIESVRDNLATEIDKRTDLLKSIVKEKYRDVVETSDAIQSMRTILTTLEQSIQKLDSSIANFYHQLGESNIFTKRNIKETQSAFAGEYQSDDNPENCHPSEDELTRKLLAMTPQIWDHFDSGNLRMSVKSFNECMRLLEKCKSDKETQHDNAILENLEANLKRAEQMIKNFLWYKIQSAETNQIGMIAGSDEEELYNLSLQSSIEFMVDKLRKDLYDSSYQAQIRRYQEYSYFNTSTSSIDSEVNDMKPPSSGYVQIPRTISIELSEFLFEICQVINTIAGFSLTRTSILASLRETMSQILNVYGEIVSTVDTLNDGSKRRRAMQLYFDLMYIRVLLNTSKDLELIEELDPRVLDLMSKYEQMLDTIELYMISDALHTNVLKLSTSTIRLYGLLVPHLQ